MAEPYFVDNQLIGYKQGKTLAYFNSDTPQSPFSNFYQPEGGFNIYLNQTSKGASLSATKSANTKTTAHFDSVEQFFAYGKAITFGDRDTARKIYHTHTNSGVAFKRLGRQVKNFDSQIWAKTAPQYMQLGMEAKVRQDEFTAKCLKQTVNFKLVEANPYDKTWGAGVSVHDDFEHSPGQNLQGKSLMQVRSTLGLTPEKTMVDEFPDY